MAKEQRVEYIDFFRGIGIILMIINHIGFGGVIYNFSHAFHMPMFFIISGYFYSKKNKEIISTVRFVKRKAKTLLLPYFVFGLFHYIVWIGLYGFSVYPLTRLFFYNTEEGMPIAGALWFLTALFITDVLFFILDRYIASRLLFVAIIIGLSVFGTVSRIILPFTLPFALSAGFVGLGLFGIGFILKKATIGKIYCSFQKTGIIPKIFILLILSGITGFLIYLNDAVNMRDGRYGFIPLFWINATLATTVGLLISKEWIHYIKLQKINGHMCKIGRESIVYLCLNQIVIFTAKSVMETFSLPFIVKQLFILSITMVTLFILCRIVFATKLKVLFGK